MDDHVVDLVSIYQNVMHITHESIESRMFERGGNDVVVVAHSILTEAQNVLGYHR